MIVIASSAAIVWSTGGLPFNPLTPRVVPVGWVLPADGFIQQQAESRVAPGLQPDRTIKFLQVASQGFGYIGKQLVLFQIVLPPLIPVVHLKTDENTYDDNGHFEQYREPVLSPERCRHLTYDHVSPPICLASTLKHHSRQSSELCDVCSWPRLCDNYSAIMIIGIAIHN
jgi:hypothetical protein